jgi:polyprenyl P-hydroxybenzoate/phenylacrylic acid decarboxylase-like protein
MNTPRRIVLAITGASGSIYARRIVTLLQDARAGKIAGRPAEPDLSVHIVASAQAPAVWAHELGSAMPDDFGAGTRRWDRGDFSAPFASGSNAPDAVIVAPCSMSALARVAHGGGDDLVARACDVALKERRPLVLVVRETPQSLVHLRNMVLATEAGAIVLPAVPSFYAHTKTLQDAIDTVVVRALDRAGLRLPILPRWGDDA